MTSFDTLLSHQIQTVIGHTTHRLGPAQIILMIAATAVMVAVAPRLAFPAVPALLPVLVMLPSAQAPLVVWCPVMEEQPIASRSTGVDWRVSAVVQTRTGLRETGLKLLLVWDHHHCLLVHILRMFMLAILEVHFLPIRFFPRIGIHLKLDILATPVSLKLDILTKPVSLKLEEYHLKLDILTTRVHLKREECHLKLDIPTTWVPLKLEEYWSSSSSPLR